MEYLGGGSVLDLLSITSGFEHAAAICSVGLGCEAHSVYTSVSLSSCMKKGPNSASDTLLEMIGVLMKPVFAVSWETSELIPHSQEGCCLSELSQPWIPGGQTWGASQPLFRPSHHTQHLVSSPDSGCPTLDGSASPREPLSILPALGDRKGGSTECD